jgi:ABC-type nitrate/sulfonate/bicarbonate transport system substrate-binding protein
MTTLTISGVPEHFNLPWHIGIENGDFSAQNINLQWTDVPEGTGKLCQMLRNGETDIAVILTEGVVKDIVAGNPSKIVQIYVQSPLIWGIHVAANSPYKTIDDLENKIVAISRYGSGSHLMAYVQAQEEKWNTANLRFEVINTLDGAVEALTEGTADYFMWERFMTKPIVDKGIFRRVGDCPTPWPSFVIAVTEQALATKGEAIAQVLDIINSITLKFKEVPNIDETLANRYGQKVEDIREWLKLTRWSQTKPDKITFDNIQEQLLQLGITDKKISFENLAL